MKFAANVLNVMIASPSDLPDERDAVEAALHGWSVRYGRDREVILLPWRWETSAVPELGGGPQQIINRQGVDDSEIVIALFGSRMGSPTAEALSGTAEEIQRAVDRGIPVHCYFSTAPLPNDVDVEQLNALRAFKSQLEEQGLLGDFGSVSELNNLVWQAVEYDISRMDLGVPVLTTKGGVQFLVQPKDERELSNYDKKGKPKYTTRHWVEVTNNGSVDAEHVTFESVGESGMSVFSHEEGGVTIHAGQTRKVTTAYHFGGGGEPSILKISWVENGEPKEAEFHV